MRLAGGPQGCQAPGPSLEGPRQFPGVQEVHAPLVSCETTFEHLKDSRWVIFDCRHDLGDPEWGPREFGKRRIPGAIHAHIDRDLAGPVGAGGKGRHPLPIPGAFVRFLRQAGVNQNSQVVCYDDVGGAWAARLWWLLRHYGHDAVALLDGGLQRWRALGLPIDNTHHRLPDGDFDGKPGTMPVAEADEVLVASSVVDARAPERYRGETEPIDPVAGHIPGAVNLPFAGNVGPDGLWLSPDELAARFAAVAGPGTVAYCGSGVTAANNILAMELAGLPTPRLYPGGWSQWCRPADGRPVATGEEPGSAADAGPVAAAGPVMSSDADAAARVMTLEEE